MAKEQETATATVEPKKQPERNVAPRGEIIIEIVTVGGGDLLCDPLRETLRSKFDPNMIPVGARQGDSKMLSMPTIPGMCIALNITEKYVRVFDPLSVPNNRGLFGTINTILTDSGKEKIDLMPERRIRLRNDDQVATWLYWMQRQVGMHGDFPNAVHVKGSASINVELPGDPQINFDQTRALGEPVTLSQMREAVTQASKPIWQLLNR